MTREYRAGFFFCGSGPGALGFLQAHVTLCGQSARFVSVGGIDFDPLACADFETLTNSPALCCDIRECTPSMLRALMGETAPDVVFGSPPCQGYSRLLSQKISKTPKYQELNRLVLVWIELVLATWDEPPALFLMENVEGIAHRGAHLLKAARKLLRDAGYVMHESTHDCGEIGGLAQHRSRYLIVARRPKRVPHLLYQPPKKRVRGCGEVIGELPLPADEAGGRLHKLPRMTPKNWLRLALIPAGGDWRDLEGVLADGQARREVFGRYKINAWDEPVATIAGSGTNGVFGVADPRVSVAYDRGYGVLRWDEPSPTVAGGSAVGQGAYAVADPRFTEPDVAAVDWSQKGPVARPPVLIARDGTWHRPLTLLDLAALQGLPHRLNGEPLDLAGDSLSAIRTRIGNAVPVGAAKAIAERKLATLLGSDIGAFSLSSDAVWVESDDSIEPGWARVQ